MAVPQATAGRRRGPWMRYLLPAVAVVVAYFSYAAFKDHGLAVEIGTVNSIYPSQAFTLLNASGYVVAQTKADVASKATGRLEKLEVEEGSVVAQGQILARIDDRDMVAALNQAAANVLVAKTNLEKAEAELRESTLSLNRVRALAAKHFVSSEAVDTEVARHAKAVASVDSAKAEIKAAEAAYEGAKVALDHTLIRAPFAGVVLRKRADVGDILAPFSSTSQSKGAVVSMADLNTLKVEVDVSESSLAKVHLGQPCEVQLDALPDRRYRGVVDQIVPTVDRTKATVTVKVRFLDKDERVLPDMSAKVAFLAKDLPPDQRQPVTAVPGAALVKRGGGEVAFLVDGPKVRQVAVSTGGPLGELVTVTGGLKPGDRVVLQPPAELADGAPIRPAQP
ncbi:Acriflavin resistance protein [Candidatus Methylocalor cossyra]|uniref:Acriflavin resistance protein n=2 Tax=Candidatus Methylocalor cossyra TaxID=3108543 RepID=A0ABP1C9F9_9GAMM